MLNAVSLHYGVLTLPGVPGVKALENSLDVLCLNGGTLKFAMVPYPPANAPGRGVVVDEAAVGAPCFSGEA